MLTRSVLFASLGTTLLLASACAIGGRGDSVDDDDGSYEDDSSLTTTGTGSGTGTGGTGGTGGSTSASTTGSTGATTGSTTATTGATTGSSSSSTGGGACPVTNLTFNDQVCGGCVETACCSSLQACDGSTSCLDFIDCLSLCTDQTCADDCSFSYPSGYDTYVSLDSCMATSCDIECGA